MTKIVLFSLARANILKYISALNFSTHVHPRRILSSKERNNFDIKLTETFVQMDISTDSNKTQKNYKHNKLGFVSNNKSDKD